MHTLLVLSAVLTSLTPSGGASVPARFEVRPSLTLPRTQHGKLHLLDTTKIHDKDDEESSTLRVLVELQGGVVGGGVSVLQGLFLITSSPEDRAVAVALGLYLLGTSAGVSIAGWAMDGRGLYGYALLGGVIGFTVPILIGLAAAKASGCLASSTSSRCEGFVLPVVVGMVLLTPLGATAGYELSAPTPWLSLKASRAPTPAPRVAPMVALARQGFGVTVGLAGSL